MSDEVCEAAARGGSLDCLIFARSLRCPLLECTLLEAAEQCQATCYKYLRFTSDLYKRVMESGCVPESVIFMEHNVLPVLNNRLSGHLTRVCASYLYAPEESRPGYKRALMDWKNNVDQETRSSEHSVTPCKTVA